MQIGYKDLMKNLDGAMKKAVKYQQDKDVLLMELKRISKEVKKTQAFKILRAEEERKLEEMEQLRLEGGGGDEPIDI